MRSTAFRLIFCSLVLLLLRIGLAQQVTISTDRDSGVYDVAQPITFHVHASGNNAPHEVTYSLKKGGFTEIAKGTLTLTDGAATIEAKLDEPNTLLAEIRWGDRQRALAGAVAAPDKIKMDAARPADFDAFWEQKIKELSAVPMNEKLEPAESNKPNVDYWKITLHNIRGTHIHGQLARPNAGDKLPALLIVQYAGVYPLQKNWVTDRAAEGWLVLNIEAHDLPIDQSPEFYRQQQTGPLRDYMAIGNDDRETSYFLRMYLSCYRAADYLTQRPDWNGKTLVVLGTSQGGMQTLMLSGLHPKITAGLALVPAGSDLRGPDAGRAAGWPAWYWATRGKDAQKVRAASDYYEVGNFAAHISCPLLVGVGLIDETSAPAGVFASINQAKGPMELVILPKSDHQGKGNTQAAYYPRWTAWLAALREGKPLPMKDH
jgi:cephalosporin-C deacetylase